MPHARVVIATYNQVPFLRLVLRGYLRQTTTDFTLVLADDGSGPEQKAFIEEWRPKFEARGIPVEHVWHEDSGWQKNKIMNEAVRRAQGEKLGGEPVRFQTSNQAVDPIATAVDLVVLTVDAADAGHGGVAR